MCNLPSVSVVIPTYNRVASLRRTLDSLGRQTYPVDGFEVIVVDDGSTDGTPAIAGEEFGFSLRYVHQSGQGATVARNAGARLSQGQMLVFVDDDIDLHREALAALVQALDTHQETIVLGDLLAVASPGTGPLPQAIGGPREHAQACDDQATSIVPFARCMTGLLAVRREDFFDLGMFQDPTDGRGWPSWDDVDFGYRAQVKGYELRRCPGARAYHCDHVLNDLDTCTQRWRRAARSGVLLFHKHPELQFQLPMFQDKTPVGMRHDSLTLIINKVFHLVTAWPPLQWAMRRSAHLVERVAPSSTLLRLLYRWTISSYIYRGYREGLRLYGPVPVASEEGESQDV